VNRARRDRGDTNLADIDVVERLEPGRRLAEPVRAGRRGEDPRRPECVLTPGNVEVVAVVVMGNEYRVDWADLVRGSSRTNQFGERGPPGRVLPRRIERRIQNESQAREFEDSRRPPMARTVNSFIPSPKRLTGLHG